MADGKFSFFELNRSTLILWDVSVFEFSICAVVSWSYDTISPF